MKLPVLLIIAIALVLVACAHSTAPTRQVAVDLSYKQIRDGMHNEPIPYPASSAYDSDQTLKSAFLHGFKNGWQVTLAGWLGNATVIPTEFQISDRSTEAWTNGWHKGTVALYESVQKKSGDNLPIPSSLR